jgi:quinol monooxygenase YgiN
MIHVLATIELQPGTRERFLVEFNRNVPNVLAEQRCLEYGAAVDSAAGLANQPPLRDDVVVVVEKWQDLEALRAHLAAPHMAEYRTRVREFVIRSTIQVLAPA